MDRPLVGEVEEVPVATSWPKAAEAGSLGELETRQCFHVLGFDVMLTSDGKPHLLEVSCYVGSPFFCCLLRAKRLLAVAQRRYIRQGLLHTIRCWQTAQAFDCAPLRTPFAGAQLRRVDCANAITAQRR